MYLTYIDGALSSTCARTNDFMEIFMPHQRDMFLSFHDNQPDSSGRVMYEPTTTYLLARDEDYENTFHSSADFVNMFLVQQILGYDLAEQQILLMDRHPFGPYISLLQKAFAPLYGVYKPLNKYRQKKVMFRKLIFHLESPASIMLPEAAGDTVMRCHDSTLVDAYRRHVLQAFDMLNTLPPLIPSVTLILRRRTPLRNVGRVLANVQDIVQVISASTLIDFRPVDLASKNFDEQMKVSSFMSDL